MKCIFFGFLVLIVSSFSLLGCPQTNHAPVVVSGSPVAPVKSEAIHRVRFSYDIAGSKGFKGSLGYPPSSKVTGGLDGNSCSYNDVGRNVLTAYEFEFVDHQDGCDVYRVTRSVTGGEHDGRNDVVDVKYSGKTTSVFDDEISTDVME